MAKYLVAALDQELEQLATEHAGGACQEYPHRVSLPVVSFIPLKDVTRAANLSPGYLTTLVRRRTGRTVLEWIQERRMAEARRLLVETDESVERIGALVGYDDPTYFIRRFRSAHKATPASWRNANR